MFRQGIGLSGTFVTAAVLVSAGLAHANPDFSERAEAKFAAPRPAMQASTDPAGKIPASAENPDASSERAGEVRRDQGEARAPWNGSRSYRYRVHRPDPIDVIATRAKIVRAKLRARFSRFALHRRRW